MYTSYPRVTSGNFQTTLDNSPLNNIGAIYSPPPTSGAPLSTKGLGAQPVCKYLFYKSTSQPAPVAVPAPVYYVDESFTTVSGNAAEAFTVTGLPMVAGYLLPNTTAFPSLTAAILQSTYVWVQVGGLLVAGYAPAATAVGDSIIGIATGNFVAGRVAAGTAATSRPFGTALTAVSGGTADILLGAAQTTFWGS
jgi:hypothetical protein